VFSRLAQNEPGIHRSFIAFLTKPDECESIVDYGTGPRAISAEDAASATAEQFIDAIAIAMSSTPGSSLAYFPVNSGRRFAANARTASW
jgi:hypothetical protein